MKKLTPISLALFAFSSGAFAQGSINLDNSTITPGVSILSQGDYYYGTYGIEVWELNQSTPVGNITGGDDVAGYARLTSDGFKLEKTFTGQTITVANAGVISLGEVDMSDVSPAGATVDLALVLWTGSGSNPLAPTSSGNDSGGDMGAIEFVNPTANYTLSPRPIPENLTGWGALGQDLILTGPEPSTFALASLGAAAFILNRRKK